MLKEQSEDPEQMQDCWTIEQQSETERDCVQFRASLWLDIAADIRRRRLSRETKGQE